MIITINYRKAVNIFLRHLENGCVKDKWIKSIEKVLQGKIKYLIARELKACPLSPDNKKNDYPVEEQRRSAHFINEFNSFVNGNPFLADATHGEIFTEMEKRNTFTGSELNNIKEYIYKIIMINIDDLQISVIPEKIIEDCMRPSSNFAFTHGRRFFKFLINNRMLDRKYLTPYKSKILNALRQPVDYSEDDLTLQNSAAVFLNYLLKLGTLAHSTIRVQYYNINNFVLFTGAEKKINIINQDNITQYLQYLKNEKGYSPSSRKSTLVVLKRFFGFFAGRKTIKKNPARNIKIKIIDPVAKNILIEEELVELLGTAYLNYKRFENIKLIDSKAALDKWLAARDWAIVSLLICTGIRTKEVVSLRVDSIDFQNRFIKIDGKGDNTYRIRERTIPLTEPLALSALEIYIKLRPASIYSNLFLNMRLEKLNPSGINLSIKNITNKLFPEKILNVTCIRKSFISHCAQKGIDPLVLRQIMGHASLKTTMKYYLSIRDSQLRDVWEKNNPLNYFSKEECEEWMI